jgi:anti-anti-sigma regulatory factor
MLRITWDKNGEVVFKVSGQLDAEHVGDLTALFSVEAQGRRIVLDLLELMFVDRDAVHFLESCEANGIALRNCPTYIREWITRERGRS